MTIGSPPLVPMTSANRPMRANETWAVDFMVLDYARRPFVMLITDVGTRRPLSATVSLMTVEDIIIRLERLVRRSASPQQIWMDYGTVYTVRPGCFHPVLQAWATHHNVRLAHSPTFATRCVSERLFTDLSTLLRDKKFPTLVELGHEVERWRQSYAAVDRAASTITQ